ncbi:MAG: RNA polymerase sigma factor SigJ [Ilumatobacteraceae bacterium]
MPAVEQRDQTLLLNVAYRMLGSVSEAEDAVQEAFARWYSLPEERRHEVQTPTAWLVTTVSRICLDILGSARNKRESYVGEWLPEPVPAAGWTSIVTDRSSRDPADAVSLDESLHMALLIVLEAMTPPERVAFVLHDVFGYQFDEIAEIVGRSPQACRQLASTGRRHIRDQRHRQVDAGLHAQVIVAFKEAWEVGDLAGLVQQLDPDVVAVTDGGGLVSASVEPISGAIEVARYFIDVHTRQPDLSILVSSVNALPGIIALDGSGAVIAAVSIGTHDGRVDHIWVMRNPQKLTAWKEQRRQEAPDLARGG